MYISPMLITQESNTRQGHYEKMWTALLIGESNTGSAEISIQITHVEPGGEQPAHSHPEEQCYYIITGNGVAFQGEEVREVRKGDAIFIPPHVIHGIRNHSQEELAYLTANKAFGVAREREIWNKKPTEESLCP